MSDDTTTTDEAMLETSGAESQNTEAPAEEFDPERAMALIQKLRSEARATAKELKAAQDAIKQHEDAKLTEQERLQRELDALRSERDAIAREAFEAKANSAISAAAQAAGALRPDAIARLVDLAGFDGDNAGELVQAVKATYPELFAVRPGNVDAGAGKGNAAPVDFNTLIRQATGR